MTQKGAVKKVRNAKNKKNREKRRLIKNLMALKEEKTAVSAVFSFYWMLFANPKPRRSAYRIRLRVTHRANSSHDGSV